MIDPTEFDKEKFMASFKEMTTSIFNNAYRVPCFNGLEGGNKVDSIADMLVKWSPKMGDIAAKMRENANRLSSVEASERNVKLIMDIPWIGDFLG